MKIRNGFVSNSSSSSFIVLANSSINVYRRMIRILERESNYHWCISDYEDDLMRKKPDDFNMGIYMPYTCNYETYIFPAKDGKCVVHTCNNHYWSNIINEFIDEGAGFWPDETNDDKTEFIDVTTGKINTAKGFFEEDYGD